MNLELSRQQMLIYWVGTPNQNRRTNRLHGQVRIGAAQRELSRANGERFLALATAACCALTGYASTAPRCSPKGPVFGTKPMTACGGLGKSSLAHPSTGNI